MVNHLLETSHPLASSVLRLRVAAAVRPSILRTHFQVPYPATPLFATLTKTPGVWGGILPTLELSALILHYPLPTTHCPLSSSTKTPGVWGVFFPNWNRSHGPKPARLSVLSSLLLPALQPRKRAGNDRAHP